MSAECHFYILNRDDPDNSQSLYVDSSRRNGWLILDEPPMVGDLIGLSGMTYEPVDGDEEGDEEGDRSVTIHGMWRVLARAWSPAGYGSMTWRGGDRQPTPVWLDVMLEPAPGIFDASHYPADKENHDVRD